MSDTILTISPLEFSRLAIFKSVSMVDVEAVLLNCPLLRVESGTVIISAGQPLERMYVLLRGEVSVRLGSVEATPVATFAGGEVFGEFAAIDGEPASAFVVAETPCRLLGLNRDALWEMFGRSPHVANNLLSILTRRMRKANQQIKALQRQLGESVPEPDSIIDDPTESDSGTTP